MPTIFGSNFASLKMCVFSLETDVVAGDAVGMNCLCLDDKMVVVGFV